MPVKPPSFRPGYLPSPEERVRQYNQDRGSARKRGYDHRWDKASKLYKREHPLCLGCQAVGKVEPTTTVDHVIPHNGDPVLMWDQENWQPVCSTHHSVVKQRLERMFEKGEAKATDLRLNSPMAMALTRDLMR